ncbi:MAG: sensor histidine kinase, partial [Pseudobutyrivibrio sp.]|nr:sensor histidine kinase [Pseudobutyrivibrio sp.]MCF0186378.1 sensor histidine kinase [Bacteroidaceae bacterium]
GIALAALIGVLLWYTLEYNTILANVTQASAFNQNFKNDVDLKMFYYVIESAYSEGMPTEEVESARQLAESLLTTTTERDSIEAIESVRDLCITLDKRMNQIAETDNYDKKVEQLDNNIYILTDLIQTYMYNYLYCESVHLSALQADMERQIRTIIVALIFAIIMLFTGVMWFSNHVTRLITDPLTKLNQRVKEIAEGDLTVKEPIEAHELEIQVLSDGFENMTAELNALMDARKNAERRKRHAELELLQSQINPHFLYNTLDTIIWLIEADAKDKSIEMVNALSNFFRYSLSKGRDVITLAEEEQHVLSYLQIQKTRYQDRMDYTIDIPESLHPYILPKLTLQPLVENSIYHGIKLQRDKGEIHVSAVDSGDTITLTVSDTGAGMSQERLQELKDALKDGTKVGFGLRTVHLRLQFMYGDEYGLTLESEEAVGTKVVAVIPKIKAVAEENVANEL